MMDWPADKVERRAVKSLIPYIRNARTHSPEQIAQIAASIREWGWTVPILVDETDGIIAGHGRVLAAQKLGLVDVPVMVAAGWSEAQKRADEPFSGSGTTIIAAEMTGRACHAIELNPAYIDVAVTRWQNFSGGIATLESTGQTFVEVMADRQPNQPIKAIINVPARAKAKTDSSEIDHGHVSQGPRAEKRARA
jgi:ParB-like nuclease domain